MTKIKSSFVVVPLFIEPAQFIVESIDTSLNIYTATFTIDSLLQMLVYEELFLTGIIHWWRQARGEGGG